MDRTAKRGNVYTIYRRALYTCSPQIRPR